MSHSQVAACLHLRFSNRPRAYVSHSPTKSWYNSYDKTPRENVVMNGYTMDCEYLDDNGLPELEALTVISNEKRW
jgi:hypothetical protein